jgi:hypothetical protein
MPPITITVTIAITAAVMLNLLFLRMIKGFLFKSSFLVKFSQALCCSIDLRHEVSIKSYEILIIIYANWPAKRHSNLTIQAITQR